MFPDGFIPRCILPSTLYLLTGDLNQNKLEKPSAKPNAKKDPMKVPFHLHLTPPPNGKFQHTHFYA